MSDAPEDKDSPAKPTLADDNIKTSHGMDRRTMLRGFGIGTLGLGAAGVAGCVPTTTTTTVITSRSGWTDRDNGPIFDPGGNGRGPRTGRYTGWTDRDNGPIVDPGGQGRGPQRR
jgi:hypothetical protein